MAETRAADAEADAAGSLKLTYQGVLLEVIVTSKLVYNLLRGRNQPPYIEVKIQLPSTMDIPVAPVKGEWGVPLTVYPWYLLCSLGILGDNLPINTHYIGLI